MDTPRRLRTYFEDTFRCRKKWAAVAGMTAKKRAEEVGMTIEDFIEAIIRKATNATPPIDISALDPKALAATIGSKKLHLARHDFVEACGRVLNKDALS